jgi:hypothetical protein
VTILRAGSALSCLLAGAVAVVATGCAPIPPPRVLEDVDHVAESPAALDAKKNAAPAWARAEQRRKEAHAALEQDLYAQAQILAEEASALYQDAVSLARVTKATLRAEAASQRADAASKELASVDAELARETAEVAALEQRLKIAQGAEPAVSSGKANPDREAARREAARALGVEARLLCMSARALGAGATPAAGPPSASAPEDPSAPAVVSRDLAESEARLGELDASLAKTDKPVAIDLATRTRASCLSVLVRARRGSSTPATAGSADALLEEIGAMNAKGDGSLEPSRDERGVAVTLRRVFDGDNVSSAVKPRLDELDRVAAAHPAFALAVVVHTDKPVGDAEKAAWNARATKIADAFKSVPAAKKVVLVAGDAVPLVPKGAGDRSKNARVEIVLVAPEAL